MKLFFPKNIHIALLFLILIGAFLVRLYRFDNPIADWHSWRQADTSAVSRNFVKNGFEVLHPRFDDLSNVPSGKDNPQGYRFVEFPLYNVLQAFPAKYLGIFSLEQWGRLVTIFSSLGSITFLYLLVKKYLNEKAGLLTAFFYAFLPYNIYYGRVILPDPSMVTAFLGAIYFFQRWAELESNSKALPAGRRGEVKEKWMYFGLCLLFAISALLLKPYAAFFLLPLAVISLQMFGFKVFLHWKLWLFAILSLLPLIGWRLWMQQFPEGIPANNWLFNGNGIRFRPSFFRWIGYERTIKLISGFTGIALFLPGVYLLVKKKIWILMSFLLSSVLYVTVFATGNVQHDYYQILVMPSIALMFGIGSWYLLSIGNVFTSKKHTWNIRQYTTLSAFCIITATSLWFSWMQVKDYFNINNRSIISAGEFIDKNTPKDAKVIAIYTGDTSFLYQTNRQGWASFTHDLAQMVEMGADFLVLVNPTENDYSFAKDYVILAETREYLVYDLHKKP